VRVIGANPEHHRVETLEVLSGDFGFLQHLHVVTDLLKALRNVVAGAGNVANQLALFLDVGPHDLRFSGWHQGMNANVLVGDALARE
jgi:hypothetical protein